jgi:hypothetical protein
MSDAAGLVSIFLGSVVLDRPDQTGRFIAKDLIGGWAYLVGDADGDNRCRGQGVCEGGLDMTLRCAFLAAADRVQDCRLIRIFVDTRQAHQMMVRLAGKDPHVVGAIAGRPVSVLTRPDAKPSYLMRNAAERAASAVLREREHTERQASVPEVVTSVPVMNVEAADGTAVIRHAAAEPVPPAEPDSTLDWRARLRKAQADSSPHQDVSPLAGKPAMIRSFLSGRTSLSAGHKPALHNQAVKAWLQDLEHQVATISGDLQDVGI